MKNTTARYFALLYLEEMADMTGATRTEINQQMPMAQAIVAGLLFEDPEMEEAEMATRFQEAYMNAY